MKHYKKLAAIALVMLACTGSVKCQNSIDTKIENAASTKGTFFITPFYEFTSFKKLELVSHTNTYKLPDGSSSYEFTEEEIEGYNFEFGTELSSSKTGINLGYHFLNGLNLGGYVGINHFYFESWKSLEGNESHSTKYPALTFGLKATYKKAIVENLNAIIFLSYSYSNSGTTKVENMTGEDIASSGLKSMYWESNFALAYTYNKFTPYLGVGYMQQYLNSVVVEKEILSLDNGEDFNYEAKLDSHYKGIALYGIAGVEYKFHNNCSIYIRSTFANLLRLNLGFRILV